MSEPEKRPEETASRPADAPTTAMPAAAIPGAGGRRFMLRQPAVAFLHDILVSAGAYVLAVELAFRWRAGLSVFETDPMALLYGLPVFTVIAAVVYRMLSLYRGIWRYASLDDLLAILKAASLVVLLFLPAMFLITRLEGTPRSALVLCWLLLLVMLAGPRLLYRLVKDRTLAAVLTRDTGTRVPVLLLGAGDEADVFIREMARTPHAPYRVVGILDEGGRRVGGSIRGIPVLGMAEDLEPLIARLAVRGVRPQKVIVTRERLDPAQLRAAFERAEKAGLSLARLPRLTDLHHGPSGEGQQAAPAEAGGALALRPIAIEDLLGRPQTVLDRPAMAAMIAGRRVLVTGAGGTIGGELARQIAGFDPARLVLVDNAEFALYRIDLELSERADGPPRRAVLADVRDRTALDALFAAERPEIVFHAAALKHVPMVEANPLEGLATNVIGTRNVGETCRRHGVSGMVLISTDKAINPTSVMGATKRVAECVCQALDLDEAARGGTRYVTVRFGNVLGSTGSVVPLFQRQLGRGGPLTVTHPDMQRYFMTVREAVELVIQAATLGLGSAASADATTAARGGVFVLDMGQPVKIADLARQMIRLAGLQPDVDVKIVYTGLRPGEKLFEELFHDSEVKQTPHGGIFLGAPRTVPLAALDAALDRLDGLIATRDEAAARDLLRDLVPEFASPDAAISHAAD